jgi:hypothetical protein
VYLIVKVTCVQVVTPVVANTIYESAGIVASAKDVRFDPVVVLVIAVADDKRWFAAAVDLSVPWPGSIVQDGVPVPTITAWHSTTVMATNVKPMQMFSEAVGFSTVMLNWFIAEAPATPDVPLVPDPLVPEVPFPEVPEVPLVPPPLVPLVLEVPEVPATPEVPEVPAAPEVPLVPAAPLVPDVPALPEVPLVPDPEVPLVPFPEVPDVPEPDEPLVPEVPTAPLVPEVPSTPDVPEVPVAPVPLVPEVPASPEVPEVPDPEVPEVPTPEVPEDPPPTTIGAYPETEDVPKFIEMLFSSTYSISFGETTLSPTMAMTLTYL